MRKSPIHIVIVNAIFPPDRGASGRAAFQLVEGLKKKGFKTTVVTTNQTYKATNKNETTYPNVIRVKNRNQRRTYLARLLATYVNSKVLLQRCASIDADMFILCTDPPFLNFLAPKYLKDKKYLIWNMDLYPEAIVAKGIVSDMNWLVRRYKKRLKSNKISGTLALGKAQEQFISNKYISKEGTRFVLPCGVHNYNGPNDKNPSWKRKNRILFAYCGNLGEAHSSSFLLELIIKSNPQKHHFVLSAFGPKALWIQKKTSQLTNVTLVDWIHQEEIHHVDIQIVSLKKEWTHICVPSKAVSSICYHTPILFHGSADGDTFKHFERALWHIPDDKSCCIAIDHFYASLQMEDIGLKKKEAIVAAKTINDIYQKGMNQLSKFLSE